MTGYDFETRQIHAGSRIDSDFGARITPIYQTAGYAFDDFDDAQSRFAGTKAGYFYSRNLNPTNAVAEERLADLEGGVGAVLTSSGQAAIAAVLFSLAPAGSRVVASASLYQGTKLLFDDSLAAQGIRFTYVPESAPDEVWRDALAGGDVRAVYTETIPNPKNDVVDLARLARLAHETGVPLIVDNTVATPYLSRPIEHGADVVVHSTSKWLAGHGAVIGGVIVDAGRFDWAAHGESFGALTRPSPTGAPSFVERFGSSALIAHLKSVTIANYGPTMPALSAFLLLQGIETLSVRMDRHVANAQHVAEWLEKHPAVAAVDYPGLPSSPFHERAREYLPRGAGSVVSFDLAGGREAAIRFIDALELISRMTHIGDVRTLALHTGSTIHGKLTEQQRLAAGITPGLIRLSVGLESARDIVADLDRGLAAAHGPDHDSA
ncbi:PLP-dependent transferase [Microbacterium sp. BWT-B31]|uniref:O-acetylhomoserine aminocarboxypropyltransferase/cysteine synthase family protein n=1 Tax=Microbacterium sp. BWT-B31 TaxID=3232072 RepID=UPI003529A9C4